MPDAATNSSLQFNSIQPGMEVVRLRAWLNHSSCFSGSVESNRKSERNGMQAMAESIGSIGYAYPNGVPVDSLLLALAPHSLAYSLFLCGTIVRVR